MSLTTDVQKLYVAFFNRPADFLGLQYWIDQATANGGSTAVVANAFSASTEYKAIYSGLSTAQIINTVYMNLFNRPAEPAGLSFWGGVYDKGYLTLANIAISIANGAQNDDLTTLNAKVTAATNFTANLDTTNEIVGYSGDAANAVAKAWLSTITSSTPTTEYTDPAVVNVVISKAQVASAVYTITPASTSVDEGAAGTFNITTKDVPDGTVLTYTFSGTGVAEADITGGLSGSVTVTGGKATVTMPAIADKTTEGAEVVTLTLVDKATSTTVKTAVMTITDTSVNTAPAFSSSTATATVKENVTTVYTASAPDAESDTVVYSLAGVDAALFSIDAATGAVSFVTAPNYEVDTKAYNFDVVATDGKLSSTQKVTVNVTDVNEAPTFAAAANASMTVAENSTATITNSAAMATDVDSSDTITYSLSGADSAKFSVNSSTGAISFATGADFEALGSAAKSNVYSVNLVATDKAGLTATQAETITVTNVNEAPTFASSTASVSVAENSSAAITSTAGVASDVDASTTLTYSLSGADAALFDVSSAGALSFKAGANYEALGSAAKSNSYSLNLIASDGALSASQAVTVAVTDVNEAPTFAASTSTMTVAENSSAAITNSAAMATDVDASDSITYSLTGADAASFDVSSTGAISFKSGANFEALGSVAKSNTYSVTLVATDKAGLTATQAETITVTDANEAPTFLDATAALTIAENSTATITTTADIASDVDASDTLTYTLSGTDSALFSVSSTGALSFKTGANYEVPGSAGASNSYSLNMIATDKAGLSATRAVTVAVTDANDAPTAVADTPTTTSTGNNTYRIAMSTLLANDTDPDTAVAWNSSTLKIIGVNTATSVNGTPLMSTDEIVFLANSGARTGTFTYTLADMSGTGTGYLTSTATVSMNFNSAPSVTAGTLAVTEATSGATTQTGTIAATDPDSDTMTYALSGGTTSGTTSTVTTTKGSVSLNTTTGAYTYTYTGTSGAKQGALAGSATDTDTFSVIATDSLGSASSAAATSVTITGVDNAPALVSPAPSVVAATSGQGSGAGSVGSTALTIDLNGYATDADTSSGLTWSAPATTTKGGTISVSSAGIATVTYAQGGGSAATGTDTFVMSVKDATNAAVSATVTVTVSNTAPAAVADSYTDVRTGIAYTMSVTSNDTDADGNTLTPTVTLGSLSAGGSAEVVSGTTNVVYTSTVGYTGTETFTYVISDGFGGSSTGTVTATVNANTGGTSGNDTLYGSKSAENIDGLAGNDSIIGGGGLDTITGGDGNDVVTFNDGAVQILGGNDADTLVINGDAVAARFDFASTTQQNIDSSSRNSLNGTTVVRGFENLDATKSSNPILLTSTASGSDPSAAGDNAATTSVVTGSSNDWLVFGNATGTVTVTTGVGNDTVYGAAGATIAGTGKYSIDGGAGNDSVSGSAQNDTLIGGTGNDTLTSGAGNDSITGDDGADRIVMGANLTSTDTVAGGSGTDLLSVSGTVTDAAYTAVSGVETLTSETGAALTSGTLDALAAAAGITTVTFNVAGTGDLITVGSGFSNALTVNNEAAASVLNTVSATAYTGVLTLNSTATSMHGFANAFAGGTGTADSLVISVDATKTPDVTSVSNIETITLTDGDTTATHTTTLTLANANATYTSTAAYQTITVDASALTVDIATVNAVAEVDAKVVIKGGSAADNITVSASANFGDSITGGSGNDTISFTVANLTSLDTIAGGSGTDKLTALDGAAIADAAFTNVTSVETLTDTTTLLQASIGALATAAGITGVTFGFDAANLLTVGSGFTNALTVGFAATDAAVNTISASAYTGALTVSTTSAAADTSTHVITGGTGTSDAYTIGIDGTHTIASLGSVTNIETIQFTDGATSSTHTATVTLANANATYSNTSVYQTVTVDASTLSVDSIALNTVAEVDGKVVVKGGSAADVITISASANFGDSITGGNGNDTFSFTVANLTSADTIGGGSGTDKLLAVNAAAIADAAFTSVTSVEVLTDTTTALLASVGALAAAGGVTAVTFGFDAANQLTVGSGFSNALTVSFASDDTAANEISASAYTGALTVSALLGAVDTSTHTITGGTGTSDVLQISIASSAAVVAGTLTNLANVETIRFTDGDTTATHTASITLNNANATYTSTTAYQTVTVDASTLTVDIMSVHASNEADAKVVIKGGSGADLVTISASANFGDSIDAGAGNDTITVTNTAHLTSVDTISGGAGTDTLAPVTGAAVTVTDAMFTSLALIETLSLTEDYAHTVTLGSKAVAAGIVTVTTAGAVTATRISTIDLSGMVGSAGVSVTGGAGSDQILGSTGNDTISGGTQTTASNNVMTGGAGADTIDLGSAGSNIVKINLNADVASGTTLASADQWSNFTTTVEKLDLSGTTLMTTGGTILALTNGAVTSSNNAAVATTNDGIAADDMGSTTATRFLSTGTVSDIANLGSLTNQGVMIFKLTTDIVTGTTSGVSNTLLNQAGVTEAVTYITASIGTATVANTNVFLYVNDGTNSALFQYQEGTLDQGIASTELTLVGVFVGITNVAAGDII